MPQKSLSASEHLRKFEREWMTDLIADHPDVSPDELYWDGLKAYLATDVEPAALRKEIARMAGVSVDEDGF
jgi:hypothetical protein